MKINIGLLIHFFIAFSLFLQYSHPQAIYNNPKPLVDYPGKYVKQIQFNNKVLSLAGSKSFTSDITEVITNVNWPILARINVNKSSVLKHLLNGNNAMMCGDKHITLFDNAGGLIKEFSDNEAFDVNRRCSFVETVQDTFLFAYMGTTAYHIKIIQYDKTKASPFVILKKGKLAFPAGLLISIIVCDYVKYPDNIICIYNNDSPSLVAVIFNSSLIQMGAEIPISTTLNTIDFQLLTISDNKVIAFYAFLSTVYAKILTYETQLIQEEEKGIVIVKDYNFQNISLTKLSTNIFICVLNSLTYIFIQKLYFNLEVNGPLVQHKIVKKDYGMTEQIIANSVGVIDTFVSIIVTDKADCNWRTTVIFPLCNSKEYDIRTNEVINLIGLGDANIIEQKIIFTKKTPLNPPEMLGVSIGDKLEPQMISIGFTKGGVFIYTFIISEFSNVVYLYSIECNVTLNVCYELCETCYGFGNVNDHQCLTCVAGYRFNPKRNNQCLCDNYFYYDLIKDEFVCLPDNQCTIIYPFLISETRECLKCELEYQLEPISDICLCYSPFVVNKINKKCVTYEIFIADINDRITNRLDDNILGLFEHYPQWNNSYFNFTVNDNNPDNIVNTAGVNLISIDLGECEKTLRQLYNIPKSESLLVGVILYKEKPQSKNKIEYNLYSMRGIKLDTSICSNLSIIFDYPLPPNSGIDIDKANRMRLKGINVLNPRDSFFNDLCYPYKTDEGLDMTIADRRTDLFQNISLCEPDCYLEDITFDPDRFKCNCKVKIIEETTEVEPNEFLNAIPISNSLIITCYKQFFQLENLVDNIAFWVLSFSLGLFVCCYGSFNTSGINYLLSELNKYPDRFKLKKQKQLQLNCFQRRELPYNNQHRSNLHRTKGAYSVTKDYPDSHTTVRIKRKSSLSKKLQYHNNPNPPSYRTQKEKEKQINKTNLEKRRQSQYNEVSSKNTNRLIIDNKPQGKIKYKNEKMNYSEEDNVKTSIEYIEYNCPYTYAVRLDKRNIFSLFWNILKHNYIFIQPFTYQSPFDLISVKLSALLLNLMLQLTINALFYSDDIVSEKYKNNGQIIMLSSLLKSIYSCLLNALFISCLIILSKYQQLMELIVKEYQIPNNYLRLVKNSIQSTRRKLNAFFFCGTVTLLFCWYYCGIFCIIYRGNQYNLFIDELISIGIATITAIGGIIVVTIFRYISVHFRIRNLYYTSIYLLRFFG